LVDGVEPTNENVNNGSYVLARPLYYLSNGEPTGLAKKFVDFSLGPKGQKIVADIHFVPVN
jgi:phosphate transport system substrate-binding protein